MEKKVIIEEIGMYEDQPGFAAYDHAKRVHFGGHKLGNSILGTVKGITALTRNHMHEYFQPLRGTEHYRRGCRNFFLAGSSAWWKSTAAAGRPARPDATACAAPAHAAWR